MNTLKNIEKQEDVKFLFAIESGSRAWKFASEDSDYDIRCIHTNPIEAYLGFNAKEQINKKSKNLDIESWDIRKFVELIFKSNPQIAEWLRSPIVYLNRDNILGKLKKYFDKNANFSALRKHYYSMSKSNYRKYMGIGVKHSSKKWLYVLRAIACELYIEKNNTLPPLPYKKIIIILPDFIQRFFEKCVEVKNKTEKIEIFAPKKVIKFVENYFKKEIKVFKKGFKQEEELIRFMIKKIKQEK